MSTVKDLGSKLKRENPGRFDHLTDEQVGRAAKSAAQAKGFDGYNHYYDSSSSIQKQEAAPQEEATPKKDVFADIVKDLTENSETERISTAEKYSAQLEDYLNPRRGVLTGWFQSRKSVKREELARNLGAEKLAVFNQTMAMAESVRNGTKTEIEYKKFIQENAVVLLEVRSRVNRIIEADRQGLPEIEHTRLKVIDAEENQSFERHQKRAAFDAKLDLYKERESVYIQNDGQIELAESEINLRIKEFTEKNKIEWQRYRDEKELDVQAAIIANIAPVFEANALTTQLFKVIDDIVKAQFTFVQQPAEPLVIALPRPTKPIPKTDDVQPVVPTKIIAIKKRGRPKISAPSNADTEIKQDAGGRSYSKEEVIKLINDYSQLYGISPQTPLCIAQKESGFNYRSANKHSTAKGVFQYLNGTWKATDEGKAGRSVFDADANVKAAVKYMAIHRNTRPWVVAPQCPKLTINNK